MHTYIPCAAVLVALMSACAAPLPRPQLPRPELGQHISYSKTVVFDLVQVNGRYQLRSSTDLRTMHHTPASTWITSQAIGERYYAPLVGLRAWRDGRPLGPAAFESETPELRDVFASDLRIHRVRYGGIRPGTELRLAHQRRYVDIAYTPWIELPNVDYVRRFELVFNHPPDVRVDLQVYYPRTRLRPQIERGPTRTRISWSKVPYATPTPYFAFNDAHAIIWPSFTTGGRALNPVDARGLGRWYLPLLPKSELSTAQRTLARQLVAGAKSPREKLRAIYDYVRKNVHYVGDERALGSIVPRPAQLVLERRYGDCKDKAFLIAQLAREVGLDVDLVLLATSPSPEMKGVHLRLFDHAIASLALDGERIYFDATNPHAELGELPGRDAGQVALLLDPSRPRKLRLPLPSSGGPAMAITIEARPGALSTARARVILRGDLRHAAAELQRTSKGEALARGLSRLVGSRLYGLMLDRFRIVEHRGMQMSLEARADLSRFGAHAGAVSYWPIAPFRVVDGSLLERKKDAYPVHLPERSDLSLRIALPGPARLTGDASWRWSREGIGRFSATTTAGKGGVTLDYRIQLADKRFSGARRAGLLELFETYLRHRRTMHLIEGGS